MGAVLAYAGGPRDRCIMTITDQQTGAGRRSRVSTRNKTETGSGELRHDSFPPTYVCLKDNPTVKLGRGEASLSRSPFLACGSRRQSRAHERRREISSGLPWRRQVTLANPWAESANELIFRKRMNPSPRYFSELNETIVSPSRIPATAAADLGATLFTPISPLRT